MPQRNYFSRQTFPKDLIAGTVVFLVALPLCLGVALASGAPLFSGLLAGIIGGLVVGAISKSHSSVSGPAAGLTAVVFAQIASLGTFETFLAAVAIGGLLQIAMGACRAGFLADFFPSSVIKGLLTAIGIILILKQIPHLVGHDIDPEGEMSFLQPDERNTFSELLAIANDLDWGAAAIGMISLAVLLVWENAKALKRSIIPGPLVVVVVGVSLAMSFATFGPRWTIEASHFVQVYEAKTLQEFFSQFRHPDWAAFSLPAVWQAGIVLALVASLETLLNLEAIDKLDPYARRSPPNRELVAQGIGNLLGGFLGAIPVTSVIVRSSVNINSGGRTRVSTIVHGILMLGCVAFLAPALNRIPLSCLAAILIVTGYKLASPAVFKAMYAKGRNQFAPFLITVIAIVFTNLLLGVVIGLVIALTFILWSNARQPLRRLKERHISGEVTHIELPNQVSFLKKAAIQRALADVPEGGHILIDARTTDYIDPDILDLFHEFERKTAPSRKIQVSLVGFQQRYKIVDRIQYVDHSTRELQRTLTPQQVLTILKDGHKRFCSGERLARHLTKQVEATAAGQFPLAAVLSCIDSRAPAEIIFDLGVGDIFSARIAGNIATQGILGSLEYACAVAGSKLILVLGHSRCGAVTAAVEHMLSGQNVVDTTGCTNLGGLIDEIQQSIDGFPLAGAFEQKSVLVEEVAYRNILRVIRMIRESSPTLAKLEAEGKIAIVGAKYDVASARIDFLPTPEMVGVLSLTRA